MTTGTKAGMMVMFAPAMLEMVIVMVGLTVAVVYPRLGKGRTAKVRAKVAAVAEVVPAADPYDLAALSAASDQFFDHAVRPELVKLEAAEVLKEMDEALRPLGSLGLLDEQRRRELLTALAGEKEAMRRDWDEREAREVVELERLLRGRQEGESGR